MQSVILVWLCESDVVLRVDREVARVDVIPLQHHLKDLWLMNGAFLHEADDLVLH